MTETFDIGIEQAHAYEDQFVPALFAQWVPTLLRHARVAPGQQVLDVACGTGVVARAASEVVGAGGRVSGVDLNPAMVEVARECAPGIDWRVADAAALPFDDASFDAALCQSALFFFPDPAQACREMTRVVRTGGVVALQTYAGLEEQPGYGPFVDAVVRQAGAGARRLLGTYWSMGDAERLRALLDDAGAEPASSESVLGQVSFPSVDALVQTEVGATPLAERIDPSERGALVHHVGQALADHLDVHGAVTLPIRATFVAGRKRAPAASA